VWNGDSNSYQFSGGNKASWTAGYSSGTTSITLSSVAGLQVGMNLILDQQDDGSDTGNIFVCQASGSNGACSQQGGSGVAKAGRAQTQNVTVTSINGTTVGISPGLYAPNWSAGKSPEAWWSSNKAVTGFGIENLSLDYRQIGDHQSGIMFHNANNCWVKNVRSINATGSNAATRKHVQNYISNHITVRDSYFYGSSPTSEGYGVDNGPGSADNLVENNVFQHIATATINETSTGNVFGYNYAVDNFYNNGAPNWQQQDGFHHGAGDHYTLWEGHRGIGFDADDIHGTSFMLTHFRSYLSGRDPATEVGTKNQSTFAYSPFAFNRYFNIVGSVLGTQSYHTHYSTEAPNGSDCGNAGTASLSVFVIGYSRQAGDKFDPCNGQSSSISDDTLTVSTLMRWGNYAACTGDAACNSVRFVAGENAGGAAVYAGLSNPSQTLPPSFYLSSKPGWWGTMPWPAIGPDVTGGNVPNVGGHVYNNPAANCYLNIMGGKIDGSSGALTFNADNCYSTSGGPPPPGSLQAVVH
jgi:hypothetical protein